MKALLVLLLMLPGAALATNYPDHQMGVSISVNGVPVPNIWVTIVGHSPQQSITGDDGTVTYVSYSTDGSSTVTFVDGATGLPWTMADGMDIEIYEIQQGVAMRSSKSIVGRRIMAVPQ